MVSDGLRIGALFGVTAMACVLWYFLFFSDEADEKRYWYWDATVILVWIDASKQDSNYGVGRGRYEVRLPNGNHVVARTYLESEFKRFECVKVRELLSALSFAPTFEIVGIAAECWQPM